MQLPSNPDTADIAAAAAFPLRNLGPVPLPYSQRPHLLVVPTFPAPRKHSANTAAQLGHFSSVVLKKEAEEGMSCWLRKTFPSVSSFCPVTCWWCHWKQRQVAGHYKKEVSKEVIECFLQVQKCTAHLVLYLF